jgi:hypothetical protein
MLRNSLGVVAGLVSWLIVAAIAGFILRASWPEYVAVADSMNFTLPMMIARLSIGALATLSAGFVIALIARSSIAPLIAGVVLLIAFVPQHVMLWDKFPLWYHLTFLLSLVPLSYAGGRVRSALATRGEPDLAGVRPR